MRNKPLSLDIVIGTRAFVWKMRVYLTVSRDIQHYVETLLSLLVSRLDSLQSQFGKFQQIYLSLQHRYYGVQNGDFSLFPTSFLLYNI